MKRLIVALMVGGVLFAGAVGLAASMDVQPALLGAGGAEVVSCDDAVQVWWNYGYENPPGGVVVRKATVAGINEGLPNNCNGHSIAVWLTKDGNEIAYDSGTVVSGGFTADFTAAPPLASDVNDVHVVIGN